MKGGTEELFLEKEAEVKLLGLLKQLTDFSRIAVNLSGLVGPSLKEEVQTGIKNARTTIEELQRKMKEKKPVMLSELDSLTDQIQDITTSLSEVAEAISEQVPKVLEDKLNSMASENQKALLTTLIQNPDDFQRQLTAIQTAAESLAASTKETTLSTKEATLMKFSDACKNIASTGKEKLLKSLSAARNALKIKWEEIRPSSLQFLKTMKTEERMKAKEGVKVEEKKLYLNDEGREAFYALQDKINGMKVVGNMPPLNANEELKAAIAQVKKSIREIDSKINSNQPLDMGELTTLSLQLQELHNNTSKKEVQDILKKKGENEQSFFKGFLQKANDVVENAQPEISKKKTWNLK